MGFQPSYVKYVEESLAAAGYTKRPWRRGIAGTRVYCRDNTAVVIVSIIELPLPFVEPLIDFVEEYFDRLRGVLAGLLR